MVHIGNDCLPCCTCTDYANMVASLNEFYTRYAKIKKDIDDTVTKVNTDITEWNQDIVPKLFKVVADIYVTHGNQTGVFTSSNRHTASGKSPNFASVIAVVRNPRSENLTGVSVVITMIIAGVPTILQSVYFDKAGEHLSGINTSWSGLTIEPGEYFKPVILLRVAYPNHVSGTFTVTVSATGIDPVTKSVAV